MIYMGTSKVPVGPENIPSRGNAGPSDQTYNYAIGDSVMVFCYTNCEEVELVQNEKLIGREKLIDNPIRIISWVLPFEAGNLVAKAYKNGVEVGKYELKTVGKSTSFRTTIEDETSNLIQLKIEIVDENNNVLTNATNVITIEVKGSGDLLGVESGDIPDATVDIQSNSRIAYYGKLLAFIQPLQKKGNIKINISSPGLESKTVTIAAK